jgi:hemoglobin/transferrin/lactoferrin receptor protein
MKGARQLAVTLLVYAPRRMRARSPLSITSTRFLIRAGLALMALGLADMAHAQPRGADQRSGVVLDQAGCAVGGAQLTARTSRGAPLRSTATAADGSFRLDGLPPGSYWLDVAAPPFADRRLRLDLAEDADPLRIVLGLAPYHSEVTVTAERGTMTVVDRSAPIVTVRGLGSRQGPLATIGNALEGASGVMVQQSTYGQVSPFLRGFTGYQVLNLVDGVRFNNTTFRSGPNQYLALIDPSQGGRVEAMLGPASAQFGSDAMGGTIQVLTPDVRFSADRWTATGAVNLFAGSADESRGGDGAVFLRGRNITGLLGASRRRVGDLRAGGGHDSHHVLHRLFGLAGDDVTSLLGTRQTDTGFSQSGVYGKASARLGNNQNVTAWYQRSKQDDVQGSKDLWGGLGRLQSTFDPQQLQLAYGRYERVNAGRFDWVSATVSVNAQDDGSTRQSLRPIDPIVVDAVAVDAVGYAVQAGVRVGGRHALVFGGEVYDEHVDARRDETNPVSGASVQKRALYPNGSRYTTTGLFVQDQFDVIRSDDGRGLMARLGGRFTRVDLRTDSTANRADTGESLGVADSEQRYQDWTFTTSLTWSVARVASVHGLVGRGFRAPNLNDLGALGLNDLGYEIPAASTIEAGALIGASDGEGVLAAGRAVTDLASERLMNYEVGLTLDWDRVHLRMQAFDAALRSPIVRRTLVFPAGAAPSSLAGLPVTPIAQTPAQVEQGVVSVATRFDPRALKAFVNDGSARYRGFDAIARYRFAGRWSLDGTYSHLAAHDLEPTRPVRRLPPQQGGATLRYHPGGVLGWLEASARVSGPQNRLSGGDLTDERIGASRRRSDITSFFASGRISRYLQPGLDGRAGTADDVFGPTGETAAQIRDRVLPIGAAINGVVVVDDSTRVPLYTTTPGFVVVNLGAGLTFTPKLRATVGLMNVLDRNYRTHGSGVDAPGRSAFASLSVSF